MKDSGNEARTYALKLLNYRARSRKEMAERLSRKGFTEEQIKDTLQFLEDTDLINDETLAGDLFRLSMDTKSLGKKGIRMFMLRRGIDKDLVEKTLSEHSAEMEEKSAREFVGKKMKTMDKYPQDVKRRKLWGMLQRRGFSNEVIRQVMDSVRKI